MKEYNERIYKNLYFEIVSINKNIFFFNKKPKGETIRPL